MVSKPNVRELAKQGNKKAIAALVNYNFKSANIRVKHLMIEDACLYIGLEGEKIESKEKIASFMKNFLTLLSINAVQKARIFGYKLESNEALWREEISFTPTDETPEASEKFEPVTLSPTPVIPVNQQVQNNNFPTTYQTNTHNPNLIQAANIKKVSKSNEQIKFKDCFDTLTIVMVILYSPFWFVIIISSFFDPFFFLFTFFYWIISAITAYGAYHKRRNMVRWFCFNLFPGVFFFGIPLLMAVTAIGSLQGSENIRERKKITWKVFSNQQRIEFINDCFERCFIRTVNPTPDYYYFHIPTKIYNLHYEPSNNLPRVYINLTYFSLIDGKFKQDKKKITYALGELYDIFWASFNGKHKTIYVSWGENNLILLPESDYRIEQLKSLSKISDELEQVKKDQTKVENEISTLTSLIKTLDMSDIYKNKVNLYKQGLKLLEESKAKAKFVIREYKKFLKEYILNFYIADVEPNISKVEHQSIDWMGRYEFFQDDYIMLKTMMQEYEKLKQGDYT